MSKQKSYKNLAIICLLGISSGLPLALVLSTLKASLTEYGFDLKTIGFFSLVSLPYSLKFLFAPIIDSCSLPLLTKKIGQRKSWLILSQIVLAIFIFGLGTSLISHDTTIIAVFAVLTAFASASQDIVIDGYRIELIEKENQGFAASFYVYGYRIGMLISGAGALALAQITSWEIVFFTMSVCALLCSLVTLFAEETRKNFTTKNHNFMSWIRNSVVEPFLDFAHQRSWYTILAFIVCFKLGDAFAGNLTLPFLLNIGFSKVEIASIVKTFGLFATLFGVFIGGVLVKKFGIVKSLWIGGTMQMFSNLSFSYLSQIGYDLDMLYPVIFVENFSGGIGDSVFVAYLSGLCSVSFSATQYALLSSLASLARSFLSAYAGAFAEVLSWSQFFILSTFLAVPGLILLLLLSKNKSAGSS